MKREARLRACSVSLLTAVLTHCLLIAPFSSAEAIQPQVTAGYYHTVGLKSDGTAVAVGKNNLYNKLNVYSWAGIIQVAAGDEHTVGLKSDGTVVAVGNNLYGKLGVSSWSGIIQVATAGTHTVGLKSDGTVIAIGNNQYGELEVSSWTDIIQVAAGQHNTFGLKSDGSVVAVGWDYSGRLNLSSWTDIKQIAAGEYYAIGLKADGAVVAVGDEAYGDLDVSSWTGIKQVAVGLYHLVGLKSDGSVVAVGSDNEWGQLEVSSWDSIIQVAAGDDHTVGMKSDGTVVAAGYLNNRLAQCNVNDWKLARYLRITNTDSDSGTVVSLPAGINCGSDCIETFDPGASVILEATPAEGCIFRGWSGDPDCADGVIDMDGDKNCTAVFSPKPTYFMVAPPEGARGAQVTITAFGADFGTKKGTVLVGSLAAKVLSWSPGNITCLLKNAPSAGLHNVKVRCEGTSPCIEYDSFEVKPPQVFRVTPSQGSVRTTVTIDGSFFGTKKGKVYLEKLGFTKRCKVTSWGMERIVFLAPKGLVSGTAYNVVVKNNIGKGAIERAFTFTY